MQDIKLVSIDVWDTLVRRHCHPDSVKLHICRYILLTSYEKLRPPFKNEDALLKARCETEGELGQSAKTNGMDDEYKLLDVYRLWINKIYEKNVDTERLAEALRKIELLQEFRVSYADPTIIQSLSKYDGIRKVFVSDFYMPAEDINSILEKNGLGSVISGGYSSCEIGLNKRSGRIFPHVFSSEGVSPMHVLHLGDNLHSDVRIPKVHGAIGVHYAPQREHSLRVQKENYLGYINKAIQEALKKIESEARTVVDDRNHHIYVSGVKRSALFVGFALYVMAEAIKLGHERVFFFTREGEFFKKIYDALALQDPFGITPPKSELLEVSRIATFSASLMDISLDSLMRLWGLYSTQSMGALFKSLDIDSERFVSFLLSYDLDVSEEIQYPWLDQRVIALFKDSDFIKLLSEAIAVKREGLMGYLSEKNFPVNGKVAIVDIGWRGTIQDNIAHLLPDVHFDGFYLGLDKFINQQPVNVAKHAFGPNMNLGGDSHLSHVFAKVSPIEMLCNSPNGSVAGYVKTNGTYQAIRLVEPAENASYDNATLYFQKGVLSAAGALGNLMRIHVIPFQVFRDLALADWKEITIYPPKVIADAYFKLKHNENFGLGRFDDKTQTIPLAIWLKGFLSISGFKQLVRQLEGTGWPEGYLALRRIGWIWSFVDFSRKIKRKYSELTQ